jgi:hypothetical protein
MSRSLYSMLLSSDLKTNKKKRKKTKKKELAKVALGIKERTLIKKMFISNFTFNI